MALAESQKRRGYPFPNLALISANRGDAPSLAGTAAAPSEGRPSRRDVAYGILVSCGAPPSASKTVEPWPSYGSESMRSTSFWNREEYDERSPSQ